MPNRNIYRPNFLTLDGITYSFNMTDHLNPQFGEDRILTDICKMISTGYKANFPMWARLLGGHRIILITPQDELYRYLDEDAREKFFNFLIFRKDGNDRITVTHFGPFGKKNEDKFKDTLDKTDRALAVLRKALDWLKSPKNNMSAKKKEEGEKNIEAELLANFWAIVAALHSELELKKTELHEFIQKVYNRPEDKEAADKLKERLTASTGKVLMKGIQGITVILLAEVMEEVAKKIGTKIATKTAAKTAAKTSSKGASKTAMKSVPILGLGVGAAFGAWRLLQGDVAGAGLEVASGAASCVPGAGTAVSLVIDAGLVAKDVYEAKCEGDEQVEKLRLEMEKIQNEVNDIYVRYNKANEEYEFAKEILEDPEFSMERLEHEIEVLEVVSKLEKEHAGPTEERE